MINGSFFFFCSKPDAVMLIIDERFCTIIINILYILYTLLLRNYENKKNLIKVLHRNYVDGLTFYVNPIHMYKRFIYFKSRILILINYGK